MARDESVFIMGEEVAEYQGAYKITRGLLQKYGPKRVKDTPITEVRAGGGGWGRGVGGWVGRRRPEAAGQRWGRRGPIGQQDWCSHGRCRWAGRGSVLVWHGCCSEGRRLSGRCADLDGRAESAAGDVLAGRRAAPSTVPPPFCWARGQGMTVPSATGPPPAQHRGESRRA